MRNVALAEVASINPRGDLPPPDASVSFVGMAELDAEAAVATPLKNRIYAEVSKGYTVFRDGDILAAKITPCWENGKVGQARLDSPIGVGSTEFHVIRPSEQVHDRYLLHFLRMPEVRETGELRMTGSAGQRRVPVAFLKHLTLPLPAFDDQRRIAAILDQADALRAKRRQVLAHLNALTQPIFHQMFGRVQDKNWRSVPLESVVPAIDNGTSRKCEARPANDGEWGILKLGAVTTGTFRAQENKAYLSDVADMAANEVNPSDVLMTRKNTRELVGAVAVVDDVRPHLLLPDLIFRLKLDQAQINPQYLQALMMNPIKRQEVQALAGGSAGSMPNISKARLKKLPIELPPIAFQKKFAARVRGAGDHREAVECGAVVLDELFDSLQSRAFRGEL